MLTFRHAMTLAHMNSQQLWLCAQDLPKVQSVKNPSMEGGGAPEAPPLTEAVDGYWRREVTLLWGWLQAGLFFSI